MRNLSPIHPQSTAPRERVITIGRHEISDKGDAFVIAEIGHNHQGSLEKAKELFQSAHMAGAHAVKLQKRHNKTLFTRPFYDKPYENENSFGITYGRHRQALEFGRREYAELAELAKKLKMEFMATAFDFRSVDFLREFDLSAYKIASGDLKTIPLIRRVAKDRTVLMVEHNLSVVADLSDRITVLARGEVLAEGPYAEVSKNPLVVEAYMGTGHG